MEIATVSQKTKQPKFSTEKVAKLLDSFLSREIEYIPYKKGNTVYIQGYRIVCKGKHVYLVYKADELIANCFYKKSAFAVVKNLINNLKVDDILDHDRNIEKHYNDSVFYMHTMTSTKDDIKYAVAENRLEIAKYKIEDHITQVSDLAKWH